MAYIAFEDLSNNVNLGIMDAVEANWLALKRLGEVDEDEVAPWEE